MNRVLRTCLVLGFALSVAGCSDSEGRVGGADKTTVRGSGGERLTLIKPVNITLRRGGAEGVTIRLERNNFDDEVKVSISQLPAGVEAVDSPRATRANEVEIVLRAGDNADLVERHQALVTAEGPEGIRATETLELNVQPQS
ncbi:MAG TPA: hypothetical protein VNT79_03495 [Phycisphaerae bacterium]|nr:hypothetical protein [Phycisphaerae bacterium]